MSDRQLWWEVEPQTPPRWWPLTVAAALAVMSVLLVLLVAVWR